jgi:hypothetical protein
VVNYCGENKVLSVNETPGTIRRLRLQDW